MTDSERILRQANLPTALVERIARAARISDERCNLHPESPTGYVGRGWWCEHKRAQAR